MQVENISNHNFGTLKYSPQARKTITKLIKEDILSYNRAIIDHLSWNYSFNHINGLKTLEDLIRSKRIKSEKHINSILNNFKEALEHAQKSQTQKVTIIRKPKTKKPFEDIIVTINDEQYIHRNNSSILNFLNKISNKILNK